MNWRSIRPSAMVLIAALLFLVRISVLVPVVLTVASLAPWSRGAFAADRETVLYSFCTQGSSCTDGTDPYPQAGLIMDASGKLYGTTPGVEYGYGEGTVFALTPNAARTKWTETVLYNVCEQAGCTDGAYVFAGLIMDKSGKLYGTTYKGGIYNWGTVFELTPNEAKTKWTETVLYSFCAQGEPCTDGQAPYAALTMDASGKLYGTTSAGGPDGWGTVFELTPNAAKTKWTETVLHGFCAQGIYSGCPDGQTPYAGLIIDKLGRLYGTTYQGGAHSLGTVFELTPNAAKTIWTETVLYSFCSQGGESCTDGADPDAAALIMDARGNLYGTTYQGGASDQGTAFELTPNNAAQTEWTETAQYSFCAQENCADGAYPGALIFDTAGRLYGTTSGGGSGFAGTVFALTRDARTSWKETVLYSFCRAHIRTAPTATALKPS
jgi:uncharacterized repeat protein (TIGR03803 family)